MDHHATVLDIIQEVLETDRSFHTIVRLLDAERRESLVAAHMRNMNNALALARHYMSTNANNTVVMNIPLNLNSSFFDTVPVVPTSQQIQQAIERSVDVTDTTCSICQDTVTSATRIRSCGHCFHDDCIQQWFTMNPRCPMCRVDIRETPLGSRRPSTNNENRMYTDEE